MSPARGLALGAVFAYWLANALLHVEFSNLVTSAWQSPFGMWVPLHYTTEAILAGLLALGVVLFRMARRCRQPANTLWCWGILLVAALAGDRFLLTTRIENIHYLQYAIISALFALALDPRRKHWPLLEILLLGFWLSVADELYQYLYVGARQGTYIDFNDLLLNQIGTLAGLLFYYGFRPWPQPAPAGLPRLRGALLGFSIAAGCITLLLIALDVFSLSPPAAVPPGGFLPDEGVWRLYWQREPGLYGSSLPTFTTGRYFVLSPLQGVVLLFLSGLTCVPRFAARIFGTERCGQPAPGP